MELTEEFLQRKEVKKMKKILGFDCVEVYYDVRQLIDETKYGRVYNVYPELSIAESLAKELNKKKQDVKAVLHFCKVRRILDFFSFDGIAKGERYFW